ncbi:helix-turn-helix domain-containing protein [Streptomyces bomunensis]|uniref:Helix-turn-helix domain-containing protein n=2 Tax=Streptomyces montanisoli TaxID=2798581 RepID=A0A940RUU0_9ACTN|nr:helix-turn-helix domain-containing protein [Streptomyces montanisoli]
MRLLTAHVAMVRETAHDLSPTGLHGARDALIELVRTVLRHEFDDTEPRLAPALARAAMDLADEHLTDPDLSPATLARRLNVSVRTLHRAFTTAEESVTAYVRRRRLERARQELLAPFARPTVSELAAHWHFADSSHFIRAFKKQYGHTPTRLTALSDERKRPPQAPPGP